MASKDKFKNPTPPVGFMQTDEYPEVGWNLPDGLRTWPNDSPYKKAFS